jgi:hypothetical protein
MNSLATKWKVASESCFIRNDGGQLRHCFAAIELQEWALETASNLFATKCITFFMPQLFTMCTKETSLLTPKNSQCYKNILGCLETRGQSKCSIEVFDQSVRPKCSTKVFDQGVRSKCSTKVFCRSFLIKCSTKVFDLSVQPKCLTKVFYQSV